MNSPVFHPHSTVPTTLCICGRLKTTCETDTWFFVRGPGGVVQHLCSRECLVAWSNKHSTPDAIVRLKGGTAQVVLSVGTAETPVRVVMETPARTYCPACGEASDSLHPHAPWCGFAKPA
jgi:hypothetical protein